MKEEKVYFRNKHRERLCGVITLPEESSKKYPLVIMCHGFTSSKDSSTYPFIAEKLYDAGILSLRFDFFGHGESEGKFEDITITEGTEDILSAIELVEKLGYVGNIALFGTSFGGVCAILTAAKSKEIVALGLKAPATDMKENRKQKLGEMGFMEWKHIGYVTFTNNKGEKAKLNYSFIEDAENIDAFEEAKRISCPVLIVHGDKDTSVPLYHSEKLEKSIKNARLEVIKGANHYFDRPGEKEKINSMFVEFFKEVLK